MSQPLLVIGVDPGETVGLCALSHLGTTPLGEIHMRPVQCGPETAREVVGMWLDAWAPLPAILAVERWVNGPRAARSRTPAAGRVTRALIAELFYVQRSPENDERVGWACRSASTVKRWANNERLKAAGLLDHALKVGRHAGDATRHALYTAVHDAGLPDPLSKHARGQRERAL